ncbi:MAG: EAL domain-containing protein [Gammaproteobacteria bacterium]
MDDKVRTSDHLFAAAFDALEDAIVILDGDGMAVYLNRHAADLVGGDDVALRAAPWAALARCLHAADAAALPLTALGLPVAGCHRVVLAASGERRDLVVSALEGALPGTLLRVVAAPAGAVPPAHQQSLLQVALENGRQGLWEWQPRADRLTFSREWYALFGHAPGSVQTLRGDLQRLLHPASVAAGRAALLAMLRGEREDFEVEHRLRHADGHWIDILSRGRCVTRDAGGQAVLVVGTHVDITVLKQTEQRLLESRQLLETVIDAFPQRVFWKSHDSRYVGANRRFARDAGHDDASTLLGLDPDDIAWPMPLAAVNAEERQLLSGATDKVVVRRRLHPVHGEPFWAETVKVPIRGADGTPIGVLGIYDDITERRERELHMRTIAEAFTAAGETRLLDALARAAAVLAGADFGFVARLHSDGLHAQASACHPLDGPLRDIVYPLADTPCAVTAATASCAIESGVAACFPDDPLVCQLGIEGYVGRRLQGADGRAVGLFVLLFRDPIAHREHVDTVIDIFAGRATAELERELALNELKTSEQRLETAIAHGGQDVWEWSPADDSLSTIGNGFGGMGLDSGAALGRRIHPDDLAVQKQALTDYYQGRREYYEYEARIRHADGSYRWMLVRGQTAARDAAGRVARIIGTVTDISALKRAHHSAEASQQFLALVIDTVPQAIFWQDREFRYRGCNQRFAELAGVATPADVIGRDDDALWWHAAAASFRADDDALISGALPSVRGEQRLRLPDGSDKWFELLKVPMRDADGTIIGVLGAVHDVTTRKQAEDAARHLACFDPLTNLPNRRDFTARLETSLAFARRQRRKGALLFIDLDQFKQINDTLGHSVGDALLQAVAGRLANVTRQEDTVARLGGDEFVVLLPAVADTQAECARQAQLVADKIHAALRQPFQFEHHQFHVTPTIGISLFPDGDKDVDDVLKEADTAMYSGKAAGRGVTRFFRREMEEAAQRRLRIEGDLRKAIVREEFALRFQPQVDAAGCVTGAEVLLRWHHPEHGVISPADFVPIAEERGLIVDIGRWVLDAAFDRLRDWLENGHVDIGELAINVSSRQFRCEDFYGDVERLLLAHRIPPQRVVFEITEGTVVEDVEATIAIMERLRRLGIRFAIDDFGTGYSSLSYLKRLPIDQLKIDRSFIADIGRDSNDEVICQTIVAMSQHLRLQTIAEGVETTAQYNFLTRLRCSGYQGYLFLPPSDEAGFLDYCASVGRR